MAEAEQKTQQSTLADIQKKLDNNEIDISKLDNKQRKVLDQAIEAGVLKSPNTTAMKTAQDFNKAKIAEQAVEEGTMKGIDVPIIGTMFNERADYELVGDVIGSFTPYIMNKEAIAKDLEKGVKGMKFMAPEGKENFKLDKFIKSSSKFQRAVSKVVGRRFGAVGRLMPRLAARLENTALKTTSFARQMAPKSIGGGGGLTDDAQSLLRTGARVEAQSIGLGATGAAAGSVAYDLANVATNVGADSLLDLNEITDDEYKKLPQPAQSIVDAGAAFANSAIFGVAGTTAGYYAVKMGRGGLKRLLGLNNPEVVQLAKLAKEKGMELNIAQLAQDSGTGSLFKNFFKILGVTPYIGGAGRKLTQKQLETTLQKTLAEGETLAPFTFAELLGSEGTAQIRKNYLERNRVIALQYGQLTKTVEAGGDFRFVPTSSTKAEMESSLKALFGGGTFKQILEQMKDTKTAAQMTGVNPGLVEALRRYAGSMTDDAGDLSFDYIKFDDHRRFRESINFLSQNKQFANEATQGLLSRFKLALDHDMAAAEKVGDEVFQQQNINLGNLTIPEAKQRMKEYKELLTAANKTYFDFTNIFEKDLAQNLRKGIGGNNSSYLTGRMVNAPQVNTTPLKQFEVIQNNVLKSYDAETIKQFKDIIGVNQTQNPELAAYAKKYMKKLASRHIFDSFMDALDPISKESIFSGSLLAARETLKKNGLSGYRYLDEMLPKGASNPVEPEKLANEIQSIGAEFLQKTGKDGKLIKVKNPNYIANPVVRKQIEDAIRESSKKIDFSKFDLVQGDFNYSKFADNLGLGEQVKEDALRELIGDKAFTNFRDTVTILKSASSLGFTDPTAFLGRRAALVGARAVTGVAATGMLMTGTGIFPGILTAVLGRQMGAILADPKKSSALLGILTEQERKYLMDPNNVKFPFTGPGQKGVLGIVDPTKPLGDYYGPKRARNLAIALNYLDDENKDQIKLDPDKISIQDINTYLDNMDTIDTPQFNVFQLPDNVLEQAFPEILQFKYAKPEDRDKIIDTMRGNINAVEQNEAEDQALEPQSHNLDQNVIEPQVSVSQTMPSQVPANQNTQVNTVQNYSFLFPQDASGQAIARQGVQRG